VTSLSVVVVGAGGGNDDDDDDDDNDTDNSLRNMFYEYSFIPVRSDADYV
jgi:hypothetical protein